MVRSPAGSPRSEKVKVSPTEAPAPASSPQPMVESSGAALPIKIAHHGERVLVTAHKVLAHVHPSISGYA